MLAPVHEKLRTGVRSQKFCGFGTNAKYLMYLFLTHLEAMQRGNPLKDIQAGVAQSVEHQLPKLRVAGSSPVSRSGRSLGRRYFILLFGAVSSAG